MQVCKPFYSLISSLFKKIFWSGKENKGAVFAVVGNEGRTQVLHSRRRSCYENQSNPPTYPHDAGHFDVGFCSPGTIQRGQKWKQQHCIGHQASLREQRCQWVGEGSGSGSGPAG